MPRPWSPGDWRTTGTCLPHRPGHGQTAALDPDKWASSPAPMMLAFMLADGREAANPVRALPRARSAGGCAPATVRTGRKVRVGCHSERIGEGHEFPVGGVHFLVAPRSVAHPTASDRPQVPRAWRCWSSQGLVDRHGRMHLYFETLEGVEHGVDHLVAGSLALQKSPFSRAV